MPTTRAMRNYEGQQPLIPVQPSSNRQNQSIQSQALQVMEEATNAMLAAEHRARVDFFSAADRTSEAYTNTTKAALTCLEQESMISGILGCFISDSEHRARDKILSSNADEAVMTILGMKESMIN